MYARTYVCMDDSMYVCMYVPGKVRGHVTMTWVVEDCVKLPFFLSVPPLRPGQTLYKIVGNTPSAPSVSALSLLVCAPLGY